MIELKIFNHTYTIIAANEVVYNHEIVSGKTNTKYKQIYINIDDNFNDVIIQEEIIYQVLFAIKYEYELKIKKRKIEVLTKSILNYNNKNTIKYLEMQKLDIDKFNDVITIGNNKYNIQFENKVIENGEMLYGRICYLNNLIRITREMPEERHNETLLHEILHGISDEYDLGLKEKEVVSLAKIFYEFYNINKVSFEDIITLVQSSKEYLKRTKGK